jgi:hypothetical protein
MIGEYAFSNSDFGLITKDSIAIPLVGVLVDAEIVGKSSRVKVAQKFENTNKKAILCKCKSIKKFKN